MPRWPLTKQAAAAPRVAPHQRFQPIPAPEPHAAPAPPTPERGLYAGEPVACRRNLRAFLAIWLHLALVLAVVMVYQVEGRALKLLLGLSLAVLPAHYLLSYRWKKPFFVASSIAGMAWVFGVEAAAWLLPIGALLIGLCYLPLRWTARVGLIAGVTATLALARANILPANLGPLTAPGLVWPLLGTMFMFRMIIFLYELKHAERPEKLTDVLAYFFLLPNYAFLHFPVVDYKTQLRGYFASDIHTIQRRGLSMIVRGVSHLLAYRLVYHLLLIPADDVAGPGGLARFLVCNYLLYLRVSGQFHVACGMLHLFGYQLPETHHHYLLATGFTDYWRRINIYWKDFMVRVVFNPVVFRLKRKPQWLSLSVATVAVFLTTWALHAYQSFWLRGRWGFSVPDTLFWGVLGLFVMVNVQQDARRPRRLPKKLTGRAAIRPLVVRCGKVTATFTTLALLWSLWSSPSLDAWLDMLRRGLLM